MKTTLETLPLLLLLLFPSFDILKVSAEDSQDDKRLVVIYDRWVDLSSSGGRHEDIHAKSTFRTVASTFDLRVEFLQITYEDLFLHEIWRSGTVAGVISIGECPQNIAVLSLAKRSKVPVLALDAEPCPKQTDVSMALPVYRVKIHRRYQCVVHVMYQWLSIGTQPAKIPASFSSPLLPTRSLLADKKDYNQEYLNCVGPDLLLDVDEIDPKTAPPGMQLELAKRFLNGRQLTIATINRPPFVILEMSGDDIVGATGFCLEMLHAMANRFNFTYKFVLPYDGNWGSPMPNGTFNGMVGMVQRQVVDLAIASFTITYIRDTVIDFTHAYYEEPTTILIPPPQEQDNFLAFLSPFTWQVWLATLITIFIVGFVMWLLASATDLPYLYPHNYRRNVSYSLLRYMWDCAFALTSQGNRMRQTEPVRVLNGLWWTFCIILIYTYTGTLIAFLTVPKVSSLIESLEELADQREVLWTYRAKTAHDSLFSAAPGPGTYHKIGQLLRERPELIVTTDKDGVDAVLRGNTAFIKEKSWLDFAMEKDYLVTKKCRLYQVNQLFFSAGFGWVLQEESIYLPLFNAEILRMMQSGLFTIWRQKYWPKPNKCTAKKSATGSGPKALHLGNFLGHFFIFGVGLGLSIIALGIERLHQSMVTAKMEMEDSVVQENENSSKDSSAAPSKPHET